MGLCVFVPTWRELSDRCVWMHAFCDDWLVFTVMDVILEKDYLTAGMQKKYPGILILRIRSNQAWENGGQGEPSKNIAVVIVLSEKKLYFYTFCRDSIAKANLDVQNGSL